MTAPDAGRAPKTLRGRRHAAWIGALLAIVALVYVLTLPMRQTPFAIRDHALVTGGEEAAIEGSLHNRGAQAPWVRVEAYLYDSDGRYLGTAEATFRDVPEASSSRIRVTVDPALASRVERYSLYAGVGPNPYAPDRD